MSVNTSRKVGSAIHTAANVALAIPRGAFILLVKFNVWGLAKVIYDGYTKGTKDKNSELLSKLKIGWYNLGGSWSALANAISVGYNKKPFLLKLAPQKIKDVYNKSGKKIGEVSPEVGIGAAVTFASIVTSALAIITALLPLLEYFFGAAAASDSLPEEDFDYDFSVEQSQLDSTPDIAKYTEGTFNPFFSDMRTELSREEADMIRSGLLTKEETDAILSGEESYGRPDPYTNANGSSTAMGFGLIGAAIILLVSMDSSGNKKKKQELI